MTSGRRAITTLNMWLQKRHKIILSVIQRFPSRALTGLTQYSSYIMYCNSFFKQLKMYIKCCFDCLSLVFSCCCHDSEIWIAACKRHISLDVKHNLMASKARIRGCDFRIQIICYKGGGEFLSFLFESYLCSQYALLWVCLYFHKDEILFGFCTW